jgi:hypothetical protein
MLAAMLLNRPLLYYLSSIYYNAPFCFYILFNLSFYLSFSLNKLVDT